jgi:hypothetical protein
MTPLEFLTSLVPGQDISAVLATIPDGRPTKHGRPIGSAPIVRRFAARRYQSSPDPDASRMRRRTLARDGRMPASVRGHYTEGEAAVLTIIAMKIKDHGECDLPRDRIAAEAGVSLTTMQNAVRKAVGLGHMSKEERPVNGRKNQTNIIRIISREWLSWLEQGPRIGFKSFLGLKNLHPTKTYFSKEPDEEAAEGRKIKIAAEAAKLAEKLGHIAGIKPERAWPPGWCAVELHLRHWLAHDWRPDVILTASRATMARKPEPGPPCSPAYFVPEITRLHSVLTRRMPIYPGLGSRPRPLRKK